MLEGDLIIRKAKEVKVRFVGDLTSILCQWLIFRLN